MTMFNSDERKNERLKYLQCWDMLTQIKELEPEKTNIRQFNEIVATTCSFARNATDKC
jgi:hypothetical protein